MPMKKKNKKIIAFVLITLSIFTIGFKVFIFDNLNALFLIAEGFDQPSIWFYVAQERIYKIAERKDIGNVILKYLEDDKNRHLHNLYIKTLGIIGEYYSAAYLIKAYAKYQNKERYAVTVGYIIASMGMLGNNDVVQLLDTLLKNYDKHKMQVTRYSLARSLYLLTGKRYDYVNSSGENTKIHLTNELKNARKVIEESKGHRRTYDEMIVLDKLYRPPEKAVDYR
jgi:hypothetical protein